MKDKIIKKFASNLTLAFVAQLVSLVSSAAMSLIVSKFLGVEQFAYWQLFIFYTTYVGLFHFGLSDGVYLRYGGAEEKSLNFSLLGSQLKCMNLVHITLCAVVVVFAPVICSDIQRAYVWIFTIVYLVLANTLYYLGFIYQAINETKVYSIAIIVSKVSFLLFIIVLSLFNHGNYRQYAILYLVAQLMGTVYIVYKGRKFYLAPILTKKEVFVEIWYNIKVGINLTFSSIASSLILGIGKIIVDTSGGLTSFGIVSLAISLTNLILNFLAQVSVVLFPILRKFNKERISGLYVNLSSFISYLLCAALVLFVPFRYILELWLPKYAQSFVYMTILFPICIFDGKMQMLYNTYMKVLRKERQLLCINVFSMFLSSILCAISIYVFKQTVAVIIAMVIAIVVRSIVSSLVLSKTLSVKIESGLIMEIILSVIFIYTNINYRASIAFLINLIAVGGYWMVNRRKIIITLRNLKEII